MTESSTEIDFRRRWYAAHLDRFSSDVVVVQEQQKWTDAFEVSAPEALAILEELARSGNLQAFGAATQAWALKRGTVGFNNPIGQMLLNQLAKRSDDPAVASRALIEALGMPSDEADAERRIDVLVEYIETIRVGAHPAPARVPFVASYWWALQDPARWPVIWPSAAALAEFILGDALPPAPAARYRAYFELVRAVEDDVVRFEQVAAWWEATRPVFLDPVLIERCRYGADESNDVAFRERNAGALVAVARHIGSALAAQVSTAAGRTLIPQHPARLRTNGQPRFDSWVDWATGRTGGLGIRCWINDHGVAIGLRPGWFREGWFDEAVPLVGLARLPGFEVIRSSDWGPRGTDRGFVGARGEFVYAKWFDPEDLAELDVSAEVVAASTSVQPLLNQLVHLASGEPLPDKADPLSPRVEWFLGLGYPTPADEEHRADRERFAAMLAEDNIALVDPVELRQLWNTGRYGNPGPQSVLNTSLRDADAAEYDRIINTIRYVCWGEDPAEMRIDKVLDDESLRVRGLGESVILKMLAVCHPDRFLPVFPFSGPKGKRRMLQLLELPDPAGDSRGEMQVRANDAIRARLDRLFPGDPWGMAQFLYRYVEWEPDDEIIEKVDVLGNLADDLLVERSFIDDIVALLEDKGQVVLYGPPGTGKTFLARKLAEALVPDPMRRSLVQFHPSTSYEDFFEGYRPEVDAGGVMTYRLTPGPLAMIAERARDAPGKRHIMIIDELNRANLPKVFGELLYLLEYRDESVRTLYRPDDAFELPKDLWFIGTMNTADRSIALVDAALRRRFHFIPFFPDQGPIAGLLERWLARAGEPAWIAELVEMVNDELIDALNGPHLQLGPSHFMQAGLDEERLRRIWRYNIEPFIEDQFFGDPAQIEYFRFASVLKRYHAEVSLATAAPDDDASGADQVTTEPT